MSKSAFIRYLLLVNEGKEPAFIKNKELIKILGDLNTCLNEIITSETVETSTKIFISEKTNEIENIVKRYLSRADVAQTNRGKT
jgi:hypothetical protein